MHSVTSNSFENRVVAEEILPEYDISKGTFNARM